MYDILENTHDLDLTPDMSRAWGQVIRGLRENGEIIIHAACLDLNTVEYTQDTIEITCKDDVTYNILKKNIEKLEKHAGKGCINIHKQKKQTPEKDVISGLKEIFGDKLTIQKR